MQVVTFLVFAGFRAFLYGVMGAYIGETFGPLTLGRVTGFVFTTGSLINLVQVSGGGAACRVEETEGGGGGEGRGPRRRAQFYSDPVGAHPAFLYFILRCKK